MFPLRWNFPFRKKDGSITTIDDAISEGGGGGGGYTLPTASAETKGGIKIGSGLAMEGEVLNNTNPTAYTLPNASANDLGGIKVGAGLSIDENGVLSATGGGGGGGALSYVDIDYTITTAAANAWNSAMIQSSTLNGKTVVCVALDNTSNYSGIIVGQGSTRLVSGYRLYVNFLSTTEITASTTIKFRIFYM